MTSLTNLSSAQLNKLVRLIREQEALQAKVEKLDASLDSIVGSAAPASKRAKTKRGRKPGRKPKRRVGRPKAKAKAKVKTRTRTKTRARAKAAVSKVARKTKRGKRGAVKEKIISKLKASGEKGISVPELSSALRMESRNVHSWFQTTGKRIAGIKKVGRARYTMK